MDEKAKERSNNVVRDTVSALANLKSFAGTSNENAEDSRALEQMVSDTKEKLQAAEDASDQADDNELQKLADAINELSPMMEGSNTKKGMQNEGLKQNTKTLSAKILLKIKPAQEKITSPEPEKPKTMIENFSAGMENMQNFLAHSLAPLLESLRGMNIPFIGNFQTHIDTITGFFGMNRLMLFTALHKNKIDPAFNTEKPDEDRQAINSIMGMADDLYATNPLYSKKGFFDAAALSFAQSINPRKVFSLPEFATFTTKNVYPKERNALAKIPVPTPTPIQTIVGAGIASAPAATPAGAPVSAEQANAKLSVIRTEKGIQLEQGTAKMLIKLENGKIQAKNEKGENKAWNIFVNDKEFTGVTNMQADSNTIKISIETSFGTIPVTLESADVERVLNGFVKGTSPVSLSKNNFAIEFRP